MRIHMIFFVFFLICYLNPMSLSATSLERGQLLYENHCTACHESMVHIRENHKADSLATVQREVIRWSEELRLGWQGVEISDVSQYLFQTYYSNSSKTGGVSMNMTLTSPTFSHHGTIPSRYTCEGEDISPELLWSGLPTNSRGLVLILDDPDAPDPAAPKRTWVHWVLYNIPVDSTGLPEDVSPGDLPQGALQGVNDWQKTGYGGPCPPIGRHRYFHKLYALDSLLPDLKQPTKAALEQAMQGHILGQTELIGTYQKTQ